VPTEGGREPETRISTTISFTFGPITWFDAYFHILNYKLRLLGPWTQGGWSWRFGPNVGHDPVFRMRRVCAHPGTRSI